MLRASHLNGFNAAQSGAGGVSQFLIDQITALGLTTNLVLCLDAGDSRCFDGTGQTLTDLSGSGNDFIRGATTGAGADDPSFVGSTGSWSDSTYLQTNGTQFLQEASTYTFADNWHKNNGVFTHVAIFYLVTRTQASVITSTRLGAAADAGIHARIDSGLTISFFHSTSTTTRETLTTTTALLTANSWNFLGVAYDEATTALRIRCNSLEETFTPAVSTDTDAHATPMRFFCRPDGVTEMQSGDRIAAFAAWNSQLSAGNLLDLYNNAKLRIPAIP